MQVKCEIETAMGSFPPFFEPALAVPAVLEGLWQQTRCFYLDSPLPKAFLARLAAHLGWFCALPRVEACPGCAPPAGGGGATSPRPAPGAPLGEPQDVGRLKALRAEGGGLERWPRPGAALETELIVCAAAVFANQAGADGARGLLREVLGVERYEALVAFLGFLTTCRRWVQGHPELSCGMEARSCGHLQRLLDETMEHEVPAHAGPLASDGSRDVAGLLCELRASEARFRALIEHAMDAIVASSTDGRIVLVNRGAEKMFGRPRDAMLGQEIELLLPRQSRAEHSALRSRFVSTGARRPMGMGLNLRGLRANGEVFPVDISLTPMDLDGRPVVVAAIRDISERQRLEDQLRRSQKMEAIGQLAGGVAHDFNNLIGVITGVCDLLLDDGRLAPELVEDVKDVAAAGQRAAALTRQLLAISRNQVMEPRDVVIDTLVEGLETMLRRIGGPDIELRCSLSTSGATVRVDPGQIERVIINLAVNARDAMPAGGHLDIITSVETFAEPHHLPAGDLPPGAWVCLRVSDTGSGMDAQTVDRAFEPFFTTKEEGRGTGLGLASVHGIVKQSGGHISLQSELGRGTSVSIYLPVVRLEASPSPPDPGAQGQEPP